MRDRLLGQLLPIHQEQQPLRPTGLEHPLRVEADYIRFARAGRQLHEKPALAQFDRMIQRAQYLLLIGPDNAHLAYPEEIIGDCHRGQRLGCFPQVTEAAPGHGGNRRNLQYGHRRSRSPRSR